jgi:hypothetical protein
MSAVRAWSPMPDWLPTSRMHIGIWRWADRFAQRAERGVQLRLKLAPDMLTGRLRHGKSVTARRHSGFGVADQSWVEMKDAVQPFKASQPARVRLWSCMAYSFMVTA